MKTTHNLFLIAFAVIVLFGGTYVYFSDGLNAQADTFGSPDSSLVSQNGNQVGSLDNKSSVDAGFLEALSSIKSIKIDTSLFSDTAFALLNDNTVKLDPAKPGRSNPFAPIDSVTSSALSPSLPDVITNQPIKVTNKTAVLSGTLSDSSGVTDTYFEYGTVPTLGKSTPKGAPSLIGTFVRNVSGLSPKTTYFYRAVAKIKGKPSYGEVVTFNTN